MPHALPGSRVILLVPLALLALAVASRQPPPVAFGEDGDAAKTPDGAAVFDQAIRWLRGGRPALGRIVDFHADLMDVKFEHGEQRNEGHVRLWLKAPDKYRFELRQGRATKGPNARIRSSKILNGDRMWILDERGRALETGHGPGEMAAIEQMKEDRRKLLALARFLTLDSFRGEGVAFTYEGSGKATAPMASAWLLVRRRKKGERDIVFRFAYEHTANGVSATHPLRVTVVGTADGKKPTEVYELQKWVRNKRIAWPGNVVAWSESGRPAMRKPFLKAWPRTVRVNAGLEDGLFLPPR